MKELELILTHILNCTRSELYLKKFSWNEERLSQINSILARRKDHYPFAYLLGEIEFMGLNFKIKEGVFIPRSETEILCETVIKLVSSIKYQVSSLKILDIGTGCGNIAISLTKFLPNVRIIATDISSLALDIAKLNAKRFGIKDRIEFIQADLFPYLLPTTHYLLDIIVSNPPYIPTAEIKSLSPEVRCEPRIALDGGCDGLDFYRRITKVAPRFLKEKGLLILEMGFGQCGKIIEIFKHFKIIDIVKDYSNLDRVIVAKLK